MSAADHAHPLDPTLVATARAALAPLADVEHVVERLGLIAEPTRLRVLQALNSVPELCVGDVAFVVGVSDDAASYALRLLRGAGLVRTRRAGRIVYYRLAEGFPQPLLRHCVGELLRLAAKDGSGG